MVLEITEFKSRTNNRGIVRALTWEDLKDRLRKPKITTESIDEYFDMTNEERTEIKDVGGFVGGRMKDGVRNKASLENRTLITIDVDEAKPGSVEDFMLVNDAVFEAAGALDAMAKKIEIEFWDQMGQAGGAGDGAASGIASVISDYIYDQLDSNIDGAMDDLAKGVPTPRLQDVFFLSKIFYVFIYFSIFYSNF